MIKKTIAWSAHNKFLVLALTGVAMAVGWYCMMNIRLDAIPDASMRSPDETSPGASGVAAQMEAAVTAGDLLPPPQATAKETNASAASSTWRALSMVLL